MKLLFRIDKHSKNSKVLDTSACIERAVGQAPGYHAGEIESLRAELETLTAIVAHMAAWLPEEAQRDIVAAHLYDAEPVSEKEMMASVIAKATRSAK